MTHEGARAKHINAEQQLRRSVLACMLWESTFYESGVTIAERIAEGVKLVDPSTAANLAIEARERYKLRHVPLWIVRQMARLPRHKGWVSDTLERIIQRPDELAEFLSLYWKDGRQPISKQVKLGLARAFTKFDEYRLAKYNRDEAIKLRDVLFLVHAKPKDEEQAALWKRLVDGELAVPDTWEVSLSSGANKCETWERLISENKLGGLALLRNLRNMKESGVDERMVFRALDNMRTDRILPFRFISAARYAPQWESVIERAMLRCLEGRAKLPGKTVLLVDVSGSMDNSISYRSDLKRYDAANGLAILVRELAESVEIYTFSNSLVQIPDRHGFALRDAVQNSQVHGATYLGRAVGYIDANIRYDRLIVMTDEQSHDSVPDPKGVGYMINVAAYENGVGYGPWIHIDGWSEAILDYIVELEDMV